ncbi:MAG: sulfite exporter TauE/SafE family protein [Bdellovibrionaceae bacterium]|nr:sulfite exporter TauE/SafE family protein [Pseudobdellovibrionaceae bacterium]
MFDFLLLFTSVIAGVLGAILGLGGGIILVPALTLLLHVNIRYAVAASLISVVATSSGAASTYLKDNFTNVRIATLLEVGTVTGAIAGFLLAQKINSTELYFLFGCMLFLSAVLMLKNRKTPLPGDEHAWAKNLKLSGANYNVAGVPWALGVMFVAGVLSALLGIGSGILKVLAMDGAMKLPIKVSTATSNFMIGVTAAASAGAYLLSGDVRPELAVPISIGTLAGSRIGARLMLKMEAALIRKIFMIVLTLVSFQMMLKGLALHE